MTFVGSATGAPITHGSLAAMATAAAVIVAGLATSARVPVGRRPSPPARTDTSHQGRSRRAQLVVWLAVSLLVVGAALGPLLAASVVVVVVVIRAARPIVARRRRDATIARMLPDVVDLLVLSIRAGLTPRQAIGEIGPFVTPPFDAAFAEVVRRTERGEAFPDAVRALPDSLGIGATDIADTIATGERYGLPVEPLLDELTMQARAARRRADQADARALPVRLAFPLVACTLPAYVLVAIVPAVLAALMSLGDARP